MRERICMRMVPAMMFMFCLLLVGEAYGVTQSSVIWQIGTYDNSYTEFSQPNFYPDNSHMDYYVGSTLLSEFPYNIRSSDALTSDSRYWYSLNSVTIHFTASQDYANVSFHFIRGGGEQDDIYFDSVKIGTAIPHPPDDPQYQDPHGWVDYVFSLGYIAAGAHTITVKGVAIPVSPYDTADGYYLVDALLLEYGISIINIDIKPGSDPNCFNNNGNGVIPVAIFGNADLNVRDIDLDSVLLDGLSVKAVGKNNTLLAHYEDIDADGYEDLVVQIKDYDVVFSEGDALATLTGNLYDGTRIQGTDTICIVP